MPGVVNRSHPPETRFATEAPRLPASLTHKAQTERRKSCREQPRHINRSAHGSPAQSPQGDLRERDDHGQHSSEAADAAATMQLVGSRTAAGLLQTRRKPRSSCQRTRGEAGGRSWKKVQNLAAGQGAWTPPAHAQGAVHGAQAGGAAAAAAAA
eukprot:CAMPEP_0183413356 /NCGR_PEP_ID=MMETSP0370-20130417/21652_1 /TAXON_ID=268820 /ORGANISM="Peridinium aciculiferum, Strain PAER-2" /LENGTH=153 /DNA_ID=CAMNT_0025596559 /DNA_START=77 /DNA_END=534 /DNA_ORIENTATION=-